MATTFDVGSGDYIKPWGKSRLQQFPVHVSQTICKGDPLVCAGAGYENRVILWGGSATSGFVGIAAEAITTTATHNAETDHVLVYCADPGARFAGRTVADDAVDFTDIGVRVELEDDSTNSIFRVQTDGVTEEVVMVLEYRNPDTRNLQATEGDTNALCIFEFLPGASIFIPTVLA